MKSSDSLTIIKTISNVELIIAIEFTFPHLVPFLCLFSFSSPRKDCSYHLCRAAAPKSILVIDFTNDCTGDEHLKICNTVKEYIYLNWIREGERDSCKYSSYFYIIKNLNEEIFRLFYAVYCKYILWLHIYIHVYAQVYILLWEISIISESFKLCWFSQVKYQSLSSYISYQHTIIRIVTFAWFGEGTGYLLIMWCWAENNENISLGSMLLTM